MEQNILEVAVLEETMKNSGESQLRQLDELLLSLVGGGVGEVTPY